MICVGDATLPPTELTITLATLLKLTVPVPTDTEVLPTWIELSPGEPMIVSVSPLERLVPLKLTPPAGTGLPPLVSMTRLSCAPANAKLNEEVLDARNESITRPSRRI